MLIYDSIIESALMYPDQADQKDLLWGVVRYLETGEVPDDLTPNAKAALHGHLKTLGNSRSHSANGSKGGRVQTEKGDASIPFDEIVEALNKAAGTSFKASSRETREKIRARWRDGYTLDQFKEVIRKKTLDWLGDEKMEKYLRPKTLFGTNFEAYLNQPELKKKGGIREHGEYD